MPHFIALFVWLCSFRGIQENVFTKIDILKLLTWLTWCDWGTNERTHGNITYGLSSIRSAYCIRRKNTAAAQLWNHFNEHLQIVCSLKTVGWLQKLVYTNREWRKGKSGKKSYCIHSTIQSFHHYIGASRHILNSFRCPECTVHCDTWRSHYCDILHEKICDTSANVKGSIDSLMWIVDFII